MFTLKIHWSRFDEKFEVADTSDVFVLADRIEAHAVIDSLDNMSAWEEGSYFNYRDAFHDKNPTNGDGAPLIHLSRLITVIKDEKSTFYLCSHAWLLGPDGGTIERLI